MNTIKVIPSPKHWAAAIKGMVLNGMSINEIAEETGKSIEEVRKYLKLANIKK